MPRRRHDRGLVRLDGSGRSSMPCGRSTRRMMNRSDVVMPGIGPGVRTPEAWQRVTEHLRTLDAAGDVFVRRRDVVLRLLACGMTVAMLEAVLPGWSRYLDRRRPAVS